MKKKNILFLHLESISRANLWQYRNELGTVWRLMNESYRFNNFYTNSTSTIMTRNDLYYGDTSAMDYYPLFGGLERCQDPNLHWTLCSALWQKNIDYPWMFFCASTFMASRENVFRRKKDNSVYWVQYYHPNPKEVCDKALCWFEEINKNGRAFCAYYSDETSHLATASQDKDKAPGVPGRLRVAYSLIDRSLNYLLKGMAALNIWDNTIIVGFGDHGDEPWAHGLHRGYAHGVPPYASITWTPLFIYIPNEKIVGETNQLACTSDLKKTVWNLTQEKPCDWPETDFSGIDLFSEKREVVFSQNMYALQKECNDPEEGMIKGYAVTDGEYRLVVTSGATANESGGMELYCDKSDPANTNNLLCYFELDQNGKIIGKKKASEDRFRLDNIQVVFEKLRMLLINHIDKKETLAQDLFYKIIKQNPKDWSMSVAKRYIERHPEAELLHDWIAAKYNKKAESFQKKFKDVVPELFPHNTFSYMRRQRVM